MIKRIIISLCLVFTCYPTSRSEPETIATLPVETGGVLLPTPTIVEPPPKVITYFDGRPYEVQNDLYISEDGSVWKPIQVITTAYTYRAGIENVTTSTLTDARASYGVAACPDVLPYHTVLMVPGYGTYSVDDTGRIPNENAQRGIIQLDLRIPHKRYDGVWRSEDDCVRICNRHGVRKTTVLIKCTHSSDG